MRFSVNTNGVKLWQLELPDNVCRTPWVRQGWSGIMEKGGGDEGRERTRNSPFYGFLRLSPCRGNSNSNVPFLPVFPASALPHSQITKSYLL